MGQFKRVRNGLGRVIFFKWIFFFLRKKKVFAICKVMQQTLDIKYIILNSPFISRMSSTKQTNTCSIILNFTNSNITNQNKIAQKIIKKKTHTHTHKFHFYTISTPQNIKQNYKCLIG